MLLNSGGIDDAASSPLAPLPPPAPKRSEKDEVTGTDANSKANMSRLRAANHRHARHPLPSATIFLTDSDAALTAVQELRLCPICDTSRRLLSVLASFLADALSVFLFILLGSSFLRSFLLSFSFRPLGRRYCTPNLRIPSNILYEYRQAKE